MLGACLLFFLTSARFLALSRDINDFESLNPGTKEYFASLEKLFTHPWRKTDYQTFEEVLKDWYTQMINSNCGGLPSNAGRKKELSNACQSSSQDGLNVWKFFTQDEVTWFKKNYPADDNDHFGAGFRQIHDTVKKLSKKELLCITLFTIDDNCVDSKYVRLS
eukprot:GEMP01065291.1.p1 GENE.GEMP01065291.1~~GEMP01065291.1.p1  ORF type:complete len:163 (+),score=37.81 GEMP01065291.1:96-584(+)